MRVTFLPRVLSASEGYMTKVLITSLGLLETTEGLSIPRGGLYVLFIGSDYKEMTV